MTDDMSIGSHRARCLRPAPSEDDPEFIDWEVLDADAQLIVCRECITPEEQQAMDEADMDTMSGMFVGDIGPSEDDVHKAGALVPAFLEIEPGSYKPLSECIKAEVEAKIMGLMMQVQALLDEVKALQQHLDAAD